MDLGRIIQMVMNLLLRKAVNKGVNMGIDYASSLGKKPGLGQPGPQTAAEQQQANDNRALAKRARQAARITRRL